MNKRNLTSSEARFGKKKNNKIWPRIGWWQSSVPFCVCRLLKLCENYEIFPTALLKTKSLSSEKEDKDFVFNKPAGKKVHIQPFITLFVQKDFSVKSKQSFKQQTKQKNDRRLKSVRSFLHTSPTNGRWVTWNMAITAHELRSDDTKIKVKLSNHLTQSINLENNNSSGTTASTVMLMTQEKHQSKPYPPLALGPSQQWQRWWRRVCEHRSCSAGRRQCTGAAQPQRTSCLRGLTRLCSCLHSQTLLSPSEHPLQNSGQLGPGTEERIKISVRWQTEYGLLLLEWTGTLTRRALTGIQNQ